MTWLAPIGFLGLLGVVALIIIYVIKPNYQQKMISSTFVWQLSLKYKKKRLPLSKLNNIITFICQLLILTICGLLLASPVLGKEERGDESERIVIIDASAGMRAESAGKTRFERAVEDVITFVKDHLNNGGTVSVILADDTPEFIAQRVNVEHLDDTLASLAALVSEDRCTYASANMERAIALTEEVLAYNPMAQVDFYTATEYLEKNGINVIDKSHKDDWNAAILDVKAEYNQDNHYEITVDLGCFGATEQLTVYCDVHGANGKDAVIHLTKTEFFDPTEEKKQIVFTTDDFGLTTPLHSYDYIEVYVSVEDSIEKDNSFSLFGGKRPTIKIQYASSIPNNYFSGIIRTIRQMMKNDWDIEFKALKAADKAATEGFDLYIFEHRMPSVMPTDGVVLLVDPKSDVEGSGIILGSQFSVSSDSTLAAGQPHELTKYVDSSRVTIAKYTEIVAQDGYEELAYYNGVPVILAKNEPGAKVVIWGFDLNYSNLPALPDFSFLMYNMFNYYFPSTFDGHSFEIGDVVDLTARGQDLTLKGEGMEDMLFPEGYGQITLTTPGRYTVTQRPMVGDSLIIEEFYVKIPESESNITDVVDALPIADVDAETKIELMDLILYFAIALVALMFIEWWLYTRKNY